ncbi:ABC transporter substrate-binding protein [Halorussus lipolyticus]|uniref:ABC transporter substrate-binding protein n=1 Tax=Halorussus lipolyticus TaxID=3034024 RepID=UPI0023E7DC9B|nr:ABC transporter substrate-binding protein [Halorussus sp. DT80]
MDDETGKPVPTRREFLKYGGAVVGGGLLAGCTGGSNSSPTSTASESGTTTESTATESGTTQSDGSYSVSMAPVGEVTFDGVPEDVLVYELAYADMTVAYGYGDSINSLGFDAAAGGNTLDAYYERLDGVSFDHDDLTQLNSGSRNVTVDKELLYELDSDLHLVDPCLFTSFDGWKQSDIEEIRENVAPWFGNSYSRRRGQPPEACRDRYQYYTLWEIAEKVADVFRERQRYEALKTVRDDLLDRIRSNLPPEDERPTVGSVIFMQDTFYPSNINAKGFATAHVRPFGATDVFAGDDVTYDTTYSYEQMLEFDPDVLLHRYGIDSYYDVSQIAETLADHPVASQITAVENGRVYPSGHPVQGPIMNLFQLEMTAKQLYPEQFGEWPDYEGGAYPKIPEEERLFDRQRVADVVAGNV